MHGKKCGQSLTLSTCTQPLTFSQTTTQDVLCTLGPPNAQFLQKEKRMQIQNSGGVKKERTKFHVDYFWTCMMSLRFYDPRRKLSSLII
jgi:hypothetical protein